MPPTTPSAPPIWAVFQCHESQDQEATRTRTVDQGSANPLNPRKITPNNSDAEPLRRSATSRLILNVRTNHLGRSPARQGPGKSPETTKRTRRQRPTGPRPKASSSSKANATHTAKSRDEHTENAAMIAANKHGSNWDLPACLVATGTRHPPLRRSATASAPKSWRRWSGRQDRRQG